MPTNRRLFSAQEQTDVSGILHRTRIAYLAVSGEEPYVVPINYVYDDTEDSEGWGSTPFHSGAGKKSQAIEQDPRVCLLVLAETAFEPGPGPCDDAFSYRSVLVEGRAHLLTYPAERTHALRMIVAKYDPRAVGKPFNERALQQTLIYSVAVDAVSFKQRRPRRYT